MLNLVIPLGAYVPLIVYKSIATWSQLVVELVQQSSMPQIARPKDVAITKTANDLNFCARVNIRK